MAGLQDHIESLSPLPLADKIKAIADLIPGLKAEPPKEYGFFVTHPDYEGVGNLTDLAILWLDCGRDCHTEHAPLQLRMIHQSMDDPIYEVYDTCYDLLTKAEGDGTITCPFDKDDAGCSCCNPDTKILDGFHRCVGFTFDDEEYQSLWGDEMDRGRTSERQPDGQMKVVARVASLEQVERALRNWKPLQMY